MDSKSVRIHSDGSGPGTVILDEDGKPVENVSSAVVWLEANELNRVELTITMPLVNLSSRVSQIDFDCVLCGHRINHECSHPCQHMDISGDGRCDDCGVTIAPHVEQAATCLDILFSSQGRSAKTCIRELNHDKRHFDGEYVW